VTMNDSNSVPDSQSSRLVRVDDVLPRHLRQVFPFMHFNAVQSKCLEAYTGNRNVVVSAPTGSGKTVVMEMAICRELDKALGQANELTIGPTGLPGKIVYLAPIKALAAEKSAEWTSKFSCYGLRIIQLTGDDYSTSNAASVANADVILSTAEKFDRFVTSFITLG
jgi:ATP-dependent DNA helicase HFM1/MER3